MKRIYIALIGFMTLFSAINAQDSTNTIIAKKGDGIINVLRSNGINVTKYYERFLELNVGNIRNGSELHLGRTYYLPEAPDSFENMGRQLLVPSNSETAIFSNELYAIRKNDSSLENTIYYIIVGDLDSLKTKEDNVSSEVAKEMAKELLSHGAKVYVVEKEMGKAASLGEYTAAVNRMYLKNNGAYQRLLVMSFAEKSILDLDSITIAHYNKSKRGKKMASHIGKVFQEHNILKKSSQEYAAVFTDKTNVYLASNMLPSMTYIKIDKGTVTRTIKNGTSVKKVDFASLIISGILQDYTSLEFKE